MGNTYVTYTLRGPSQRAVADALADRKAIVTPSDHGCVVVFDEKSDEQLHATMNDLGERLSRQLSCPLLAVLNYKDDLLVYQLFDAGRCIDQYDSCPGYFDSAMGPTEPTGGSAAKLCAAFGAVRPTEIENILRETNGEHGYVFAMDRHDALVNALGLSSFAVAANYAAVASGELPEGLSEENLLCAPERAGCENEWTLGLECWLQDRVEGVPLLDAKGVFIARLDEHSSENMRKVFPCAEVIAVDFSGTSGSPEKSHVTPKRAQSIFAPLEEFILDQPMFLKWYSAPTGLATVREILAQLANETQRTGAPADLSPAEEEQFWRKTRGQLEHLEQILTAAEKARTRFLLVYE